MLKKLIVRVSLFVAVLTALPIAAIHAAETYPPLPETVTSFGAFTQDGWVYVFGGHKGERHDYSEEMVSGSFNRLKLDGGKVWESLPSAKPGQGLALVASGK